MITGVAGAVAAITAFSGGRRYSDEDIKRRAQIQYNLENFLWELKQSNVEYKHRYGVLIFVGKKGEMTTEMRFTERIIGCDPEGVRNTLKQYGIDVPKLIDTEVNECQKK